MPIIRNRKIEQDGWRQLPDQALGAGHVDVPADGRIIVSLATLLRNADDILKGDKPTGAFLQPANDVRELEPFLRRLSLIAIEFPAFTEGRGYSQARILRERYGFSGEIRAIGDVTRDRLAFMERCGFDAFALRAGESPDAAISAFSEISLGYQPAADADQTIGERRAARGA